jgi:hypothetical protein
MIGLKMEKCMIASKRAKAGTGLIITGTVISIVVLLIFVLGVILLIPFFAILFLALYASGVIIALLVSGLTLVIIGVMLKAIKRNVCQSYPVTNWH